MFVTTTIQNQKKKDCETKTNLTRGARRAFPYFEFVFVEVEAFWGREESSDLFHQHTDLFFHSQLEHNTSVDRNQSPQISFTCATTLHEEKEQ